MTEQMVEQISEVAAMRQLLTFIELYPAPVMGPRPHMVMKDGFTLSVQNGPYHYARTGCAEIWSWSYVDSVIYKLGGKPMEDEHCDVLGWVGFDDIARIIALHGGITGHKEV